MEENGETIASKDVSIHVLSRALPFAQKQKYFAFP
jgi:hypothetical protein